MLETVTITISGKDKAIQGWKLTQLFAWPILAKNMKPVEPVLVLDFPPSRLAFPQLCQPLPGLAGAFQAFALNPGARTGLLFIDVFSTTSFYLFVLAFCRCGH